MPTTQQTLQVASGGLTAVNHAVNVCGLTTAIIAPLTTVAGLQAAILALGTTSKKLVTAQRVNIVIDHCKAVGILTNANVAAADTVAGLRAIFTTANSSLNAYHSGSLLGN